MPQSLLALAIKANEAALAWRATVKPPKNYLAAAAESITAGVALVDAVDELTGAIAEAYEALIPDNPQEPSHVAIPARACE